MGRKSTNVTSLHTGYRVGRQFAPRYLIEWAVIVGDRIRRLRTARGWLLHDLADAVPKPEGGKYSIGYYSRIERGWGVASLYTYIAIAAALEVEPGRLLGPDSAQLDVSEEEMTLVKVVRSLGLAPADAITMMATRPERPR